MLLLSDFAFPDLLSPNTWMELLTLTFLEIVLGVDNIIFISILVNRLPHKEQKRARNIGLLLAMALRLLLLALVGWILSFTQPLITIDFVQDHGVPLGLSVKDLILILGGIFLLYKSTGEIHHKLEGKAEEIKSRATASVAFIILQICLIDLVFAFDSVLTAVGMTPHIVVMMIAVVISVFVMMAFSGPVSKFINTHPTMQMLALSFLILIGVMLIAEGFHQHVSKGYIYFSIAFSLGVELLNMRMRRKERHVVEMNPPFVDKEKKK